ncbi:MAG: hypothetical protein IPK82_20065 [Polyangiaceae bacterium]|nr:hypothetical protein [Polyangiaceae bacterium]
MGIFRRLLLIGSLLIGMLVSQPSRLNAQEEAQKDEKVTVYMFSAIRSDDTYLGTVLEKLVAEVNKSGNKIRVKVIRNSAGAVENPIIQKLLKTKELGIGALTAKAYGAVAPAGTNQDGRLLELSSCQKSQSGRAALVQRMLPLMKKIDGRVLGMLDGGPVVLFSKSLISGLDGIKGKQTLIFENDAFATSILTALGLSPKQTDITLIQAHAGEAATFAVHMPLGFVKEFKLDQPVGALKSLQTNMPVGYAINQSVGYMLANSSLVAAMKSDAALTEAVMLFAKKAGNELSKAMWTAHTAGLTGLRIETKIPAEGLARIKAWDTEWKAKTCVRCATDVDWKSIAALCNG